MEWKDVFEKICVSFDALKEVLKDRGEIVGESIIIYDPPLKIIIERKRICFEMDEEMIAILDNNGILIFDDIARDEIEMWCKALSSLGFKRFRMRR